MSDTKQSIHNYFQSIDKFMESWLNYLNSLNPEMANSAEAKKAMDEYKKAMSSISSSVEKFVTDQVDEMANKSPEDIQTETLKNIDEFKAEYQKATDMVMNMIDEEKTYVASDQFLSDVKDGKENAQKVYNSSLNSVSKAVDAYADMFKNI